MITKIKVNNFKSLANFEMDISKFTCLVGLNGAGKSSILQFFDFLSQLMMPYGIEDFLKKRNWESSDLNSKVSPKNNIVCYIFGEIEDFKFQWACSFNLKSLSCTGEAVVINKKRVLTVKERKYVINKKSFEIMFNYQGSILSVLNDKQLPNELILLKNEITKISSLDLLSPELLRSKARSSEGTLGLGGEKLSALIHESGNQTKKALTKKLKPIYPQLSEIKTKSLRSGWKQLEIIEGFNGNKVTSVARHTNDGMLRLMAILMQLEMENNFLLFDEIENGINPELIEYLVDILINCNKQVMITTHSPLILNFIEDDIAKNSVVYLYKNSLGQTQSIRLFDIPSMAKKLNFMGAGEVFIDSNLTELYKEIEQIERDSNKTDNK